MRFQSKIGKSNFTNANLSGFDLRDADISYTNLTDVDLSGADLTGAYLRGVDLTRAYLIGTKLLKADMSSANLLDVMVTNEQLVYASTLRDATMPDGKKYDGRFNLAMDQPEIMGVGFSWSQGLEGRGSVGTTSIFSEPEEIMAWYYSVSLEEYLTGQEWAEENLPKLRGDE